MKAYVFSKKGKIELRELPAPVLDPSIPEDAYAAILRPKYLAPCSSDAHTVYAGAGPRREDLILGHEGIAEVLETGTMVQDFRPGDLVAVAAVMPDAQEGHGHEGSHFSATKLGRNIDGMWAERFKVPQADQNLARIPAGVSMEAALMAVDMMATGFTAAAAAAKNCGRPDGSGQEVLRTEGLLSGLSVLVIGSGAVGLMAVAAAHSMGAGRIFCIGTDKSRINLDLAVRYGADLYISYRDGHVMYDRAALEMKDIIIDPRANATGDKAVETVLRLTGGEGVDRILICGGGPDVYIKACDMLRYGSGTAVNVAYIEGSGTIPLPIFSLGRGMAGKSFVFTLSRGGRSWVEQMLAVVREGRLDPGLLVTHHMQGFDSIPEALEQMYRRPEGLIKIMVEV